MLMQLDFDFSRVAPAPAPVMVAAPPCREVPRNRAGQPRFPYCGPAAPLPCLHDFGPRDSVPSLPERQAVWHYSVKRPSYFSASCFGVCDARSEAEARAVILARHAGYEIVDLRRATPTPSHE